MWFWPFRGVGAEAARAQHRLQQPVASPADAREPARELRRFTRRHGALRAAPSPVADRGFVRSPGGSSSSHVGWERHRGLHGKTGRICISQSCTATRRCCTPRDTSRRCITLRTCSRPCVCSTPSWPSQRARLTTIGRLRRLSTGGHGGTLSLTSLRLVPSLFYFFYFVYFSV